MNQIQLLEIMKVRQWFYCFFAVVLFEEPNKKVMLKYMESNIFSAMLDQGESDIGISLLANSFQKMQRYNIVDWRRMQEQYVTLFSESGTVLVFPWESVYLSIEHVIYDEHTLAVQDFYKEWGAEIIDPAKGPADHIGLECSFMAFMSGRVIQYILQNDKSAIKENIIGQRSFLEKHLLVFLNDFCDLLQKQTTMDFYQGLAHFLPSYIFADGTFLEQTLSEE